jgi:two-component system sensor histidine kinase KdpD
MEQLFELSRDSLLLDLHGPPGPQLAVLIRRVFGAEAVALYDANLGRQDRAGDWGADEEDVAKECYQSNRAWDDHKTKTWRRVLRSGTGSVGALVVRGSVSPLVVDALASLAVTTINWRQSFEKEERAEKASRTEQLRAAVMDALAHEFKTPLNAVHTASSGLLESEGLTDSQREMATLIDDEIVRLSEICNRLLMTAKLEAKQVGLQIEEVKVQDLITEVLSSRAAEEARSLIHVTLEEAALTVRVDRALVVMILTQYIDNARKYSTPNTAIEIAARLSHGELVFSVHNIGSTIPIEDRERIFDRFYRSPQWKDTVPGTGVGLSAAKKAAHAHHGHVWVISEERDGTTFFLSLPNGARGKQ